MGSLLTALASWLEARSCGGEWLLRVDDLDRARCPPGTAEVILRQLDAHGLTWDGAVRYQRQHAGDYRAALRALERKGATYACSCSRAVLKAGALAGADGPVYAGTCRDARHGAAGASLRVRIPARTLCFDDAWQGRQCRELARDIGDFVVRRADGVAAYQLACAVDEPAQGITQVVRGADLLGSTFCQLWLQQTLGTPTPEYRHLPVLTDARGRKLSKQNRAAALDSSAAASNLRHGLRLLNQPDSAGGTVAEVLTQALAQWDAARISRTAQIGDLPL